MEIHKIFKEVRMDYAFGMYCLATCGGTGVEWFGIALFPAILLAQVSSLKTYNVGSHGKIKPIILILLF